MASYDENKQKLLNRLKRIEGQTRGIQRMVQEDKYCVDIMTQISSIQSALEQVTLTLMEDHMRHCVTEAIQQGNGDEKISEVVNVLKRYAKAN